MKKITLCIFAFAFSFFITNTYAKKTECRQKVTFDQNWQFKLLKSINDNAVKKTKVTDVKKILFDVVRWNIVYDDVIADGDV